MHEYCGQQRWDCPGYRAMVCASGVVVVLMKKEKRLALCAENSEAWASKCNTLSVCQTWELLMKVIWRAEMTMVWRPSYDLGQSLV